MANSNSSKIINTDKVRDVAAKIKNLNENLRNKHLAEFETAMTSTTGYSSEAATELMEAFNELKPKFDTHYQIINSRATYLMNVAEGHETMVSGQKSSIAGLRHRD